jgi:Flp pilus assembly protein TadD
VEPLLDRDPWNRWRFFGIRLQAATAEYALRRRDLDRTHVHAMRLLDNARAARVPKYLAVARQLLGEAALLAGETDRAVTALRGAVSELRDNPAPLTAWKVQASLGRALRQAGEAEGAREAFVASARILQTIAAQITDEALRRTFLEGPQVREVLAQSAAFHN